MLAAEAEPNEEAGRGPVERARPAEGIDGCLFTRRRRHTSLQGGWSSDVCSSDLVQLGDLAHHLLVDRETTGSVDDQHIDVVRAREVERTPRNVERLLAERGGDELGADLRRHRSEERRVGKEGRSRWSPYH